MSEIWSTWGLALPNPEEPVIQVSVHRTYEILVDLSKRIVKVSCNGHTTPTRAIDNDEASYLAGVMKGLPRDLDRDWTIARRCLPGSEDVPGEKPAKWYELPR